MHANDHFAQHAGQLVQRRGIINADAPARLIPRHLPTGRNLASVAHFLAQFHKRFHGTLYLRASSHREFAGTSSSRSARNRASVF